MILSKIPHNARYIPASVIASAAFNVPTVGKYDFGVSANTGISILTFQPNTWYFIDSISIGGTISEEEYCQSISVLPSIVFRRKIGFGGVPENIYTYPLPIPKYSENREVAVFTHSDKKDDALIVDVAGVLNQIPPTVGTSPISLTFAISIFQIDEKGYNEAMREAISPKFGQAQRR
jgi:hypothetical protein